MQQQQSTEVVDLENPSINDNPNEGDEGSPAIVATLIPEVEEVLEGHVHNNNEGTTSKLTKHIWMSDPMRMMI